ncbi:hypothetical protein [Pacificibacter sp.]
MTTITRGAAFRASFLPVRLERILNRDVVERDLSVATTHVLETD